jgi:hypothetical protein
LEKRSLWQVQNIPHSLCILGQTDNEMRKKWAMIIGPQGQKGHSDWENSNLVYSGERKRYDSFLNEPDHGIGPPHGMI